MKEPIDYMGFRLQVHLDGTCWVAPGGKIIKDARLAREIAKKMAGKMRK